MGKNRRTRSRGEKAERKEERKRSSPEEELVSAGTAICEAKACLKELLSELGPAHKRDPSGDGTKTHRRRAMYRIHRRSAQSFK